MLYDNLVDFKVGTKFFDYCALPSESYFDSTAKK